MHIYITSRSEYLNTIVKLSEILIDAFVFFSPLMRRLKSFLTKFQNACTKRCTASYSVAFPHRRNDQASLNAYKRLRGNVRNGLAVVPVLRDACGGCFNTVPPQRQMDIAARKKVIVCEHCGRVLVDKAIAGVE